MHHEYWIRCEEYCGIYAKKALIKPEIAPKERLKAHRGAGKQRLYAPPYRFIGQWSSGVHNRYNPRTGCCITLTRRSRIKSSI
jgi:hypothetical protein